MTGKNKFSIRKIALNVLYINKKNIYPVYISKHNAIHEKQLFFLIIQNGD